MKAKESKKPAYESFERGKSEHAALLAYFHKGRGRPAAPPTGGLRKERATRVGQKWTGGKRFYWWKGLVREKKKI